MDYIVIGAAAKPYDGRYEFGLEVAGLTTLELGWVKRFSGYLPLTIMDGYRGGDAELFTVFAVIALFRNGKIGEDDVPDVYRKLQRLSFDDTIGFDTDAVPEEQEEAGGADGPPTQRSSSVNGGSSAAGSPTSSDPSVSAPPTTGIPASATSVSAPTMSPA